MPVTKHQIEIGGKVKQYTPPATLDTHPAQWGQAKALPEETFIGTAIENATVTGTVNHDLNTFSDKYLTLTGNATFTFSNTPAIGKSVAKTMTIKSAAAQTLSLPAGYILIGSYANTGVENYLTFKFSNYATAGLKVVVTIDQV